MLEEPEETEEIDETEAETDEGYSAIEKDASSVLNKESDDDSRFKPKAVGYPDDDSSITI